MEDMQGGDLRTIFGDGPLLDADWLGQIRETARLQYLRDRVFGSFLESEEAQATLVMHIRANQSSILSQLDSTSIYYDRLHQLYVHSTSGTLDNAGSLRRTLLFFSREFIVLARSLLSPDAFSFYQHEAAYSLQSLIRGLIERHLENPDLDDMVLVDLGIDILNNLALHDPSVLRLHTLRCHRRNLEGPDIVTTLVKLFLRPRSESVRWNADSILKSVMKPPDPVPPVATLLSFGQGNGPLFGEAAPNATSSPTANGASLSFGGSPWINGGNLNAKQLDDFLNVLYPSIITTLLSPLSSSLSHMNEGKGRDSSTPVWHACDLLAFCVRNHKYRIKYLLLRSTVPHTLGQLLAPGNAMGDVVTLHVCQVLKAMLDTQDDFYVRFFAKHAYGPALAHLLLERSHVSKERDSLVTSSALELLMAYLRRLGLTTSALSENQLRQLEEAYSVRLLRPPINQSSFADDREEDIESPTPADPVSMRFMQLDAAEAEFLATPSSFDPAADEGGAGDAIGGSDSPSKKARLWILDKSTVLED